MSVDQEVASLQTAPSPPPSQAAADASTSAEGATPAAQAPAAEVERLGSVFAPLHERDFRALWSAALVSNIGTWMQNVGGAWLMTSLTPSPLAVALMQTATSLPIFLIGLPAGALADLVDRRRLLLIAQTWMLIAAGLLGFLTLAGLTTPWLLLALTFALGLGTALNAPAWQAVVPETVPAPKLPAAIALNSASFNLARALGPALGGLVVATVGPAVNFLLNAVSFLGTIVVLARWRPRRRTSHLPGERLVGATRIGIRYARHAPELRAVLVRCAAFISCASALWALLPLVARNQLGLSSSGYGLLLAALGLGAVAGTSVLPRLRAQFSVHQQVAGSSLVFAAGTLALGLLPNPIAVCGALFLTGVAWMVATAGLNVTAQTCVPKWVMARALATYLLVFQGVLAGGSMLWGLVAERVGESLALAVAAGCMLIGIVISRRWRLETDQHLDLSPSSHLVDPSLRGKDAPDPEEGPVLVTAEYRVRSEAAGEFIAAMREVGRLRRRDGAMRWGLFRDPTDHVRYLESFVIESWAEHLRQLERATVADRAIEEHARSFLVESETPIVSHLVAARPPGETEPVTIGV
ncbi:MAG: MFS transporter [Chloroflexi bacterium]|nr:MFS transporter [Chloroflexota bacterium]